MFNKASTLKPTTPSTSSNERESRLGLLGETRQAMPGRVSDTHKALAGMMPVQTEAAMPEAEIAEAVSGSRLIVGPNVKLKGAEILDCDTLVVEGRVEATMDSRVLRIAQQGSFMGKVSIDVAEIHGHFDGELTVRDRLIVYASGRVSGQIRYGKIQVEEGGELAGDIQSLASGGSRPLQSRPPVVKPELTRVVDQPSPLLTGTEG